MDFKGAVRGRAPSSPYLQLDEEVLPINTGLKPGAKILHEVGMGPDSGKGLDFLKGDALLSRRAQLLASALDSVLCAVDSVLHLKDLGSHEEREKSDERVYE
jgi:hypothetical protein